ncbi:MAG: preprotein translocase subunit YajC [Hirschia sp.]|nr:preprotein translocase subunit YajC [Hirschia sp.]MBF17099.1 preprotein translocase subunit YajC [Hirschia sp.]|tara:strand:- start:776 stop:1123 length:348 start_codon:yes stop_codon:yes gene_type:complete
MYLAPLIMQATAPDAAAPNPIMQFLPFAAILLVFYFLIIRPQQKRQKEQRAMLEALKKGDTVVTQGGIIGKISKLEDLEAVIDVGEGMKLRVLRAMIVDVRGKPQPAAANDSKAS